MRHRNAGYKLGRTASHRRAMLRNMVTSLFEFEKVVTTHTKAKAVAPVAEKMITLAKRGDLHARRLVQAFLTKQETGKKLFSEIKDRYMSRSGGYTSIIKAGVRPGDGAPLAVLELVKTEDKAKASKKKGKKKRAAKKAAPAPEAAKPAEAEKPVVEEKAAEPVAEAAPAETPEAAPDQAETEKKAE